MSSKRMSTYDVEDGDKFDPCLFQSIDIMVIKERNKAVADIEKDITGLSEGFSDLSSMMTSQGTDVDLAESKVEFGAESIKAAQKAVEQSEKYVSRRRRILGTLAGTGVVVGAALLAVTYWFKDE